MGAAALIVAFVSAVAGVLLLLEDVDTEPGTELRRTGWFSPFGLALSAAALSGLIWLGTLLAYSELAPSAIRNGCEGKSTNSEVWSWIAFADSVALFLGLTFVTATRLRISRLATITLTATVMLPLVILFAGLLHVVNTQPFCGE